ncbi:MAG: VOC family protein [Candidatus Binatia bacterium]
MFKIDHIDHVALTVKDLERSIAWYQEVLGLERRYQEVWGNQPAMLCAGPTCVALFASATATPNAPPDRTNTIVMKHLAFRVDRDNFEQAQAELSRRRIEFSFEDHGISHSIYFRDPDGHEIEITTYQL